MMPREEIKHKLNKLREEHRTLDVEILRMLSHALYDQVAVQRLKKRKLKVKDEILKLQGKLLPDIIA